MVVEKDKKTTGSPEMRSAMIIRFMSRNRQSVLRKREEAVNLRLREFCNYDSLLGNKIQDVLQEAENMCCIIAQEAARKRLHQRESMEPSSSTIHADENLEAQRQRKIDEMLQKHFAGTDLYACMASRTNRLFGSTGGEICVSMEPHMVTTASTLADYKSNVHGLPKKVLQDLSSFLKFTSLSLPGLDGRSRTDIEIEEETANAIRQAFQATDELDYQQYLRWEGLWRKCRVSGQTKVKHGIFLSSVISTLLNYNWSPSLPVQANFLSLIPLKIAVVGAPYSGRTDLAMKVAQKYRLCYVSVPHVYSFFVDLVNNQETSKDSTTREQLLSEISTYVDMADLPIVYQNGSSFSEEVNLELILLYMKYKEHTVRGFVLDGYPSTLEGAQDFRTRLDGFDTIKVVKSYERENSRSIDDPLDPGTPNLPHDLLDLIVYLQIEDELSLKRQRETEYRKEIANEKLIRPVEETKLDEKKLVETHRKLLKLKKDCQNGLLETYADMSKSFLQLRSDNSASSLLSSIEVALAPHLQARLDKIIEEPEVDILAGLHENAGLFQKHPDINRKKDSSAPAEPKPPMMKVVQHSTALNDANSSDLSHMPPGLVLDEEQNGSRRPLKTEGVGFDLKTDTQEGAISDTIDQLKAGGSPEEDHESTDLKEDSTNDVLLPSDPGGVTVLDSAQISPPAIRLAFRKFVLNEDPNETPPPPPPVVQIEEPKPDKKGKKDHGKSKAADGAKSTKGDSPYSKKANHSEKDDIDEIGLPRPVHLPRKVDLSNPLVKEYVDLISAGDSQLTGPGPIDPYKFFGEELPHEDILGDTIEEKSKSSVDDSGSDGKKTINNPRDMESYFEQKTNERAEVLGLKGLSYEIAMEQTHLEASAGAHYVNGFPVLKLDSAKCLPDQKKNQQQLLDLLDLSFAEEQEAVVKSTDLITDNVGDDQAEVVGSATENESSGTLLVATSKNSEAVVPPSSTPTLTPTDPAGQTHRDKSAVGKRPNATSAPDQQPPLPYLQFNFSGVCQWLADRWRSIENDHFACACDIFHTIRNLQATALQQVKNCSQSYSELAILHKIQFTEMLYKWQEGFNAVESYKRTRTQLKEVLHARTTDFAKLLVEEINKKLNGERTLNEDIMRNGWLDETITTVYNSFVALMQLELDTYVDALNILRDYISITEFRLVGMQTTAAITIPFIELLPLDDGRRTARSLTPPGMEGRKGKAAAQELEKEKTAQPQQPPTAFRPLTMEPISPWYVARKVLVTEIAARLDQGASKKPAPSKTERKSQVNVEMSSLTRKHSRVQASSPQSRDDIEEFMLKDVLEKAKDVVTKVQETEQDARRNRYNVKTPEEPTVVHPGIKKPGGAAAGKGGAAAAKGQPAPPVSPDARPSITFSGHERAINEEISHILSRLDGIVAYGSAIIAEIRKVAKTLDTKIIQTIEENYRKELSSATMLIEYTRSQIENEEPIRQALVFTNGRFALSCDQFVRVEQSSLQQPAPIKTSFYEEHKKLSSPDGKISYDDLQKAVTLSVERSHGKDLVNKDWYSLDSDELINAATHIISPDLGKQLPDGVNISDVQMDWDVALKALGNPPEMGMGHKLWF